MCAVSAVGDYWQRTLPMQPYFPAIQSPMVTRFEFDALKRDIEELKALLLAARRFDEATGQHDCETEDKVALIKRLADLVGVPMADVFGKEA